MQQILIYNNTHYCDTLNQNNLVFSMDSSSGLNVTYDELAYSGVNYFQTKSRQATVECLMYGNDFLQNSIYDFKDEDIFYPKDYNEEEHIDKLKYLKFIVVLFEDNEMVLKGFINFNSISGSIKTQKISFKIYDVMSLFIDYANDNNKTGAEPRHYISLSFYQILNDFAKYTFDRDLCNFLVHNVTIPNRTLNVSDLRILTLFQDEENVISPDDSDKIQTNFLIPKYEYGKLYLTYLKFEYEQNYYSDIIYINNCKLQYTVVGIEDNHIFNVTSGSRHKTNCFSYPEDANLTDLEIHNEILSNLHNLKSIHISVTQTLRDIILTDDDLSLSYTHIDGSIFSIKLVNSDLDPSIDEDDENYVGTEIPVDQLVFTGTFDVSDIYYYRNEDENTAWNYKVSQLVKMMIVLGRVRFYVDNVGRFSLSDMDTFFDTPDPEDIITIEDIRINDIKKVFNPYLIDKDIGSCLESEEIYKYALNFSNSFVSKLRKYEIIIFYYGLDISLGNVLSIDNSLYYINSIKKDDKTKLATITAFKKNGE